MKSRYPILLLIAALFLSGCQKENMGDCFKSTGSVQIELRTLEAFSRLETEDNINVFIRFGDAHKVEIEAGEHLLSMIETEVREGTLFIRNNNTCNWVRDFKKPINVTIWCNQLHELIARGYGTVQTLDTIRQQKFYAEQWLASGVVKLLLATEEVYIKSHTGPADYECSGKTNFLYAYNSSAGILDLQQIKANEAFIWSKGTGNIYIHVSELLEAQIENVGDVYYLGSPSTIIRSGNGEGNLLPL